MPSRRTHTKSRNGCDVCRTRRIKCDETGPPCGKCAVRHLDCQYTRRDDGFITLTVPPSAPLSKPHIEHVAPQCSRPESQPPSATESSGRSSLFSNSPDVSTSTSVDYDQCSTPSNPRLKELALMRQWCLQSSKSFHRKGSMDAHIWQGVVTDLGLKFSFLMDVMLALSATQIAAEADSAQARSTYTSIALEYQNSAVIAARPELLNVCADNCNALFGFTILNIPTSVVLAQLPTGGEDTGKSPLESIVISSEWISCLVSLMTAAEPWLRHGPFKEAYDNCDDPEMYDETMRQPMQRLTSLLARSKYAGREYTQQFKMFSHAVELLEERAMRSRSMSIAWPAEIGDVFVQMLKERDQMALMITLHWGVVLHSLKNWWTDFTGKRLVDQISQELPRESGVAEEAVRWARIHVGLDSQET